MSGVAGGGVEWDHDGSVAGVPCRDEEVQVTYLGVDFTSPKGFLGGLHFIAFHGTDVEQATKDN
ncbi:hypothetical protein [Streptococcus hyointestinalis]|uniref:hypothetical protein n=1 Tax=Streptococcus hyointestinalis TaxID=1337 RepID=UPI0013DFFAB0|nr:hypothetical protein [Streptococcus hyointestinalis]